MAKRFIDSMIFRKGYMRALPSNVKLFYIYLFCECDHYGIWSVELDVAEVRLGISLDYQYTKDLLDGKIVELDGGRKWFLPQFITFQYGSLSSKHKLHSSVLKELQRLDLMKYVTLALQLPSSEPTVKDMEMDMVITTKANSERTTRKPKDKASSDELKKFIDVYHTWAKDKGIMFRFTSADGAAMKQIIKQLKGIESVQSASKTPLDVWNFILTNWNTLNAWMQTQVQVRQINSQLPNIIEQIRQYYGQSKQTTKPNAVADFAKSLRNAIKGS